MVVKWALLSRRCGDLVTYTLAVANAGPVNAENTVLSDPLPDALASPRSPWTEDVPSSLGGDTGLGDPSSRQAQTICFGNRAGLRRRSFDQHRNRTERHARSSQTITPTRRSCLSSWLRTWPSPNWAAPVQCPPAVC
ncbi:MAG: DUF11 domain-containing protein [Evtepia gabavorous]